MLAILLTKGMEALVDDVDFDYLNQWTWHSVDGRSTFYAGRTENKTKIYMHIIVARRAGLIGQIDHKDRNGLNNQRLNLRQATQSQNNMNHGLQSNNTTGFKGVSFCMRKQAYKAYIKRQRSYIFLGYFRDPTEAAKTYDRVAIQMFGEFAALNFPEKKDV